METSFVLLISVLPRACICIWHGVGAQQIRVCWMNSTHTLGDAYIVWHPSHEAFTSLFLPLNVSSADGLVECGSWTAYMVAQGSKKHTRKQQGSSWSSLGNPRTLSPAFYWSGSHWGYSRFKGWRKRLHLWMMQTVLVPFLKDLTSSSMGGEETKDLLPSLLYLSELLKGLTMMTYTKCLMRFCTLWKRSLPVGRYGHLASKDWAGT